MPGGLAAMLLGKEDPPEEQKRPETSSMDEGMKLAFDDFATALKMGEREKAMYAMWDFIKMCQE